MKKFIAAIMLVLSLIPLQANAGLGMSVLFSPEEEPEAWCLAQNIYYESRGSSFADQVAVADVVLNRVKDTRYPNSVCGVVHQGKMMTSWKDPTKLVMVRNACQFSWYCDGKSDYPKNKDAWVIAQQIAYSMLYHGDFGGITEGATHYHADYVKPNWVDDMQLVGTIGEHIFYRWSN